MLRSPSSSGSRCSWSCSRSDSSGNQPGDASGERVSGRGWTAFRRLSFIIRGGRPSSAKFRCAFGYVTSSEPLKYKLGGGANGPEHRTCNVCSCAVASIRSRARAQNTAPNQQRSTTDAVRSLSSAFPRRTFARSEDNGLRPARGARTVGRIPSTTSRRVARTGARALH